MRSGQTSIEYLFIIGGAITAVVIVGAFILTSLGTPQTQAHCNFSAFSKLTPLGPNDINIDWPNSCKPNTMAKGQTIGIGTGQVIGEIQLFVGAGECNSTNSNFVRAVDRIGLFLTDSKNAIVCADGASSGYVGQQFTASITPNSLTGISANPTTCTTPTKLSFGLSNCTLNNAGQYDLRVVASNKTQETQHSDNEPGAIIVK